MSGAAPARPGELGAGRLVAPADHRGTPITMHARVALLVETRDGFREEARGTVIFVDTSANLVGWSDEADGRPHVSIPRALRVLSFPPPLSREERDTALGAIAKVLSPTKDERR